MLVNAMVKILRAAMDDKDKPRDETGGPVLAD
jgi:hypothetical protein